MPYQCTGNATATIAQAVDTLFGIAATYNTLRWRSEDGKALASGAIGMVALSETHRKPWTDPDSIRQTVMAVRFGEAGNRLCVARHFSRSDGESPNLRPTRTNFRLGLLAYSAIEDAWKEVPGQYSHSALWAASSLEDMGQDMATLSRKDVRNPRTDPIARLQLHRIMDNRRHPHGYNFQESLLNCLVNYTLADTMPPQSDYLISKGVAPAQIASNS